MFLWLCVCLNKRTGDVLEEDERDVALGAELDEVGALERRLAEEHAVVRHNAHGVPVDVRKACQKTI